MSLEKLVAIVTILSGLCVLVGFLIKRWEKRMEAKEAAIKKAEAIDRKLLDLDANYGRVTEELQEVRKDFADFVKQLLFNK